MCPSSEARLVAALEPEDVVLGGGNVKQLNELPPGCRFAPRCGYARTLTVSRRAVRGGSGRLTARALFAGNDALLALRSRVARLRVR